MKRATWRRLLGALLVAAAVWYLADAIAGNWRGLREHDWSVAPLRLWGSVAAHVAVLAWGVWVWGRVLARFEHPPVGLRTLQRIWFLSNLARYVPGKVFQFLAVAQMSRAAGLSGPVLLTSMLVQTGLALLAAVVVAAWTLGELFFPGVSPLWPGAVATAAGVLLVHPALLNAALAVIPRLLRREVIRWNGGWGDGVALLGLSVVSWILYGGAYHLFVSSLAEVPPRMLPALTGVNALSFVAGYASPLPGGAGLREVAMAGLLQPYLPAGVAAVLAIAARLWTIAAELLGGALAVAVVRLRARGAPEAGGSAP